MAAHAYQQLISEHDYRFEMAQTEGPFALGRGSAEEQTLQRAAQIVARYSKEKNALSAVVTMAHGNESRNITVVPSDDTVTQQYRI